MKKIEAETLENALIIASNDFECSVVDLEYEIIQNPSKGFLGIGKKLAIICAQPKSLSIQKEKSDSVSKKPSLVSDVANQENLSKKEQNQKENESLWTNVQAHKTESQLLLGEEAKIQNSHSYFVGKISSHKEIKNRETIDLRGIAKEVQVELKELLSLLPYRLSEVFVEPYDENTLYIKIDGEDSALLIGKEGYRYKAISYLIFNWVNHVYGLMIRLEIAEFLRNQEEMIANYLLPTIENVKTYGKAQTKPLDGVLAHIALKQLREQFPDKYVSFRLNNEGERYIIINDFHHT
ncbi:Jag N-terminal domain-containing protein [Helicobacter ganmani]|uniref:RNA-binding protein KhpB N-terminal domain-containing protein n=1 Tax=Helicobacter ganmani TaxID=60246 RepID=A0A3D8I9Z0_9HELI|nr:Jag N-terminal domain-containing protein [Helicobacter ganmani]RDU61776.1 hypothetical protein CQA43_08605 [Helicobacter ganmani]